MITVDMKKILLAAACVVASFSSQAAPRDVVYDMGGVRYFGPDVQHVDGQYVMYVTANSAISGGQPSNSGGDAGTYNATCNTFFGDRIWMTSNASSALGHFGWSQPQLMLQQGGAGESALIGDPAVVYWKGKWHMYYEGTDQCSGLQNNIFHAVADSWRGPWRKTGLVWGLWGLRSAGSGFSWPSVFVENDQLYLYFSDEVPTLRAARSISDDGQRFFMMNYNPNLPLSGSNPAPVVADTVNRAKVIKDPQGYVLVYDTLGRKEIKFSRSAQSPLAFNAGQRLISVYDPETKAWENGRVGLPTAMYENGEYRLYYTGERANANGTVDDNSGTIGVMVIR